MILYHTTQNQSTHSSFLDEAIDIPSVSIAGSIDIPEQEPHYSAAPAQPADSKTVRDFETLQGMLPSAEDDEKLASRSRNRRRPRPVSAPSEPSATTVVVESPKPRKCGRQLRKRSKRPAPTGQKGQPDNDNLSKDPGRRRILERNRIAASKCRLRKLNEASALVSRERALEDQNRSLISCFNSLATEIYYLKTELLRHTSCNCVLIQVYLANEARKSVDGLLACSPDLNAHGDYMGLEYIGSSVTNNSVSFNAQSPQMVDLPPTWATSFQGGPSASGDRDGILDVSLMPVPKALVPHNSIAPIQGIPGLHLPEYMPGLYMSTGLPVQQPVAEVIWDSSWNFDYDHHAVSYHYWD